MVSVDDYKEERDCIYKGEHYSARDNGAVMRHQREGMRVRKDDNVWTFGKPNDKTGYMEIAGQRVHRIVAYAFLGDPPSDQHVVDHIDTNRRNNRPENLRWLTRLENTLINPITRARIENICGSIEAFLANPSILRGHERIDPNFSWMRAVSPEEARASLDRLTNWAKVRPKPSGGELGEWVYQERKKDYGFPLSNNEQTLPNTTEDREHEEDLLDLSNDSFTPSAKQTWRTMTEFPCCPAEVTEDGLERYNENLKEGQKFSINQYDTYYVIESKVVKEKDMLVILSTNNEGEGYVGTYSICIVKQVRGFFVHVSLKRFGHMEEASHFYKVQIGEETMTEEDMIYWD